LLREAGYDEVGVTADLTGLDRVAVARRGVELSTAPR
jgi:hypothetical protein